MSDSMTMYLGWFDPDRKKPAAQKLIDACERHAEKTGARPGCAVVGEQFGADPDFAAEAERQGLTVAVAPYVPAWTIYVGLAAREPETEPDRVVHVNDRLPGAVYVGRRQLRLGLPRSPFANPYRIGRDGDRLAVVTRYRDRLFASPDLLRALPELRGKPLACWCRHDGEERSEATLCHADVLIDLLRRHTDDEIRVLADRAPAPAAQLAMDLGAAA